MIAAIGPWTLENMFGFGENISHALNIALKRFLKKEVKREEIELL